MVLWKTPRVRAAFGTTEEFAEQSAPLVADQGLYNRFLAAALLWGLIAPSRLDGGSHRPAAGRADLARSVRRAPALCGLGDLVHKYNSYG
jgi:hypothetical protein